MEYGTGKGEWRSGKDPAYCSTCSPVHS